MNDFEKIEHLLLSKKFEELNPLELKEVQGYFENATDYNDMRDTLMQVKSTLAADKLLIKPSVDLKEKLLQQFENTYSNAGNKTGKTRPFYRTLAFQWSAAASIVILLTLSAVTYFNNMNGAEKSKEMAVNYEKKTEDSAPSSEKKNMNSDLSVKPDDSSTYPVGGVSNSERKEDITSNAPVSSTTMDLEEEKTTTFGNISVSEESIQEGEGNNQGISNPNRNSDELNKPVMKDNTTLDNKNRSENQGSRDDDANDQYNDKIKGKEESKMLENNNSNSFKSVNEKNTNTDTKNYWQTKKQNPNKTKDKDVNKQEATEDVQLGGYMSVNQMVQTDKRDSLKTNLDSLQMDSNQLRSRQRDAKIDSLKDEKDN